MNSSWFGCAGQEVDRGKQEIPLFGLKTFAKLILAFVVVVVVS